MKVCIGVDVGTSSVKLLGMDENGRVLAQESMAYDTVHPNPGWVEIDPEIWFETVKKGLKALLASLQGTEITAIAFTGQMHTTVFLDRVGNVLRPAISWNDTRTRASVEPLKAAIAKNTTLRHIYKIFSSGSPAMNLWWLKENEPKHFEQLHTFLIGPDYLAYRFTGVPGTDYCEASTSSLYDVAQRRWSKEMQEILGLPASIFPPVRGSGQIVGFVTKELSRELHLSGVVPVVAGTGDNPAAYLAAGLLESNAPLFSLGTSGVLMFAKDKIDAAEKGKHILFSLDGETIQLLIQGVVQSAGSSFSWWQNKIRQTGYGDPPATGDLEEKELLFYPHLAGDKTIYADPFLRGAFIGIGAETTAGDMTLAVMEGVSFGVKQLMEEMRIPGENLSKIRVLGGGAKSRVWMQVLADVLQLTVEILPDYIGAAYGAALLAAYGSGGNKDFQTSFRQNEICTITPENSAGEAYRKKYIRYKKIYPAMKMIYGQ